MIDIQNVLNQKLMKLRLLHSCSKLTFVGAINLWQTAQVGKNFLWRKTEVNIIVGDLALCIQTRYDKEKTLLHILVVIRNTIYSVLLILGKGNSF